MNSRQLAALIDGLIPVVGGVTAILLSYRVIGKKPGVDSAYDARMQKWRGYYQLDGVFLILFGIALAFMDMSR